MPRIVGVKELIEDLPPQLRKAYRKLPGPLTSRIEELLSLVPEHLKRRDSRPGRFEVLVPIDRLVKYAFLVVAAERKIEAARVSHQHTHRARAEITGALHGFENGYDQPEETHRRFGRGRQARQRIDASLQGVLSSWTRTQQVIREERQHLPSYLRKMTSDQHLEAVIAPLEEIHRSMQLSNVASAATDPGANESSRSREVYSLWLHLVPDYRGKWKELHELALCWKLTTTPAIESFRQIVRKRSYGPEGLDAPFGSNWIQLLSETQQP